MKKKCLVITSLLLVALIVLPSCQKTPAEFEIASLEIVPPEVAAGETVTVSTEVQNVGGAAGTYTVTLMIDGAKVQTKVLNVAPRTTETVALIVSKDVTGTYKVEVNQLSGSFRVVRPAEFAVSNLVINPPITEVGEAVTVAVDVTNSGEVEGTYSAALLIEGSKVETKEVVVAPAATETVIFTFTEEATGSYSIKVGEVSGHVVVTETGDILAELKAVYPELYQELLRLPDLAEIDAEDNEAIEDIAYLALNPEYGEAFESMLDEGIRDKRKYCAPLEALLWIAYDREFDRPYYPLKSNSVGSLINEAWKVATSSNNYRSHRWQNFDEVVDRLSSPTLAAEYLVDNVAYDFAESVRMTETNVARWASPRETFQSKKGVCNEQARFALHCLLENGYYYDSFELHQDKAACCLGTSTLREWGHVTCLYIDDGLFYIIDTTLYMGKAITGPFSSIEEAADAMMPNWVVYELADVEYRGKKVVWKH